MHRPSGSKRPPAMRLAAAALTRLNAFELRHLRARSRRRSDPIWSRSCEPPAPERVTRAILSVKMTGRLGNDHPPTMGKGDSNAQDNAGNYSLHDVRAACERRYDFRRKDHLG